MPNRMLREGIVDSRKMGSISDAAKLFYYKLISVVDDFGRYEADAELLRRRLYSWETERVCAKYIDGCLKECTKGEDPLIRVYSWGKKKYVEILNFQQQIRAKSKYPDENGEFTLPPKDKQRKRNHDSLDDASNCDAIVINCNQVRANALRSDSTRLDSTRKSNLKEFPSEASELGIEGWDELIEEAGLAGMSFDPSPSSDLCQKIWRYRNFEVKRDDIRGIRARRECGQYSLEEPQYNPSLEKYLTKNRRLESLRPRNRGQPKSKSEENIALLESVSVSRKESSHAGR